MNPLLEGIKIVEFSDFTPNPKIEDALRGIALLKDTKLDMVMAVGGGSVIDMAKLICVFAAQPRDCMKIIKDNESFRCKGIPLIAIPTTAGTGSEATRFVVVYVNNLKHSLSNQFFMPDYAIVDPVLTYKMPPELTASTGFDALSQAIESYWSTGSTEQSKKYASEAIKLAIKSMKGAVHRPDPENRSQMALAANLAGKAINISKTTAPHAVSYALTMHFGIPHGHAVAITLGKFFLINANLENTRIRDERGREYLKKTMDDLCKLIGGTNPTECSRMIYKLMEETGLKYNLSELGIYREEDIRCIVSNVNIERLSNNPVVITEKMLLKVIASLQ